MGSPGPVPSAPEFGLFYYHKLGHQGNPGLRLSWMGQVVMNLELLIPTPSLSSGWFQSWWPHLRIETLQVSLPYDSNFDSMQITKGISPCPGCYSLKRCCFLGQRGTCWSSSYFLLIQTGQEEDGIPNVLTSSTGFSKPPR